MIELRKTEHLSPHVIQRSKKMFVRTKSPTSYIVTPKEPKKARRLVEIERRSTGTILISCTDKDTGEACPANGFGMACSHVNAALNRLLTNVRRQASKQLKSLTKTHG